MAQAGLGRGRPWPLRRNEHRQIWPSGTAFAAGDTLRLVIQGSDIYRYPEPLVYARHEATVNVGRHVIHAGGEWDSFLLVPIVP
jgi:uncharacterized protein